VLEKLIGPFLLYVIKEEKLQVDQALHKSVETMPFFFFFKIITHHHQRHFGGLGVGGSLL
jgi:hypothetical protein